MAIKLLIAGSRHIPESKPFQDFLDKVVRKLYKVTDITEVVSGKCKGMDRLGELWAATNNIPVIPFEADWKLHGKAAGPIRNKKMANYADEGIIICYSSSKGSQNMISEMNYLKKKITIITI